MYSSEAAFSKAFTAKLIKAGLSVTRIESHSTGNGIPDIFVQGYGKDFWIELKNSKVSCNKDCVTVSWRPGQQAWAYEYYKFHAKKKQTLTLMSDTDGLFIIPMTTTYLHNKVTKPWFISYEELRLNHSSLTDLIRLLIFTTHNLDYSPSRTYRDAIIHWVNEYYPDDCDYDPEVIWPYESISIDSTFEQAIMDKAQFDLWRNMC